MVPLPHGGIQSRLVSLILLGLFPVFVLVILDSLSEHRNVIDAAREETHRLARIAAAREGALIEGAHQLTVALSVLPQVVRRDVSGCNLLTRNLLSAYPQYTNFGVVDADGVVWCSPLAGALKIRLDDRLYIKYPLQKQRSALGEFQIGRMSGMPSIGYGSPIVDSDGKTMGAAFVAMRVASFGALRTSGDMPDGAIYLVVDHAGTVLQRFPDAPGTQGKDISGLELFRAAQGRSSGSIETEGVDGISRLYGFAWSHADVNQSVLVFIGIPGELVVADADRRLSLSLFTLLVVAAIAIVVGAVASRKLVLEPIVKLVEATKRIAANESNVRSGIRQRNELGDLGQAIDAMAQSLEAQQLALKDSEARFRDLTALSSDWYWEQDELFRFTDISSEITVKAGIDASDHVGKTRWELPGIELSQADWTRHMAALERHEAFDGFTYKRIGPDGGMRYFSISGRPIFDAQGVFKGYRGVGKDVTDVRIAEERIGYLAYHDALTGLPNRASFSMMLSHAIASARRDGRGFAVLFIDLDGFKKVNDTHGHEAGDALLREIGRRLQACVRKNDTPARLGGDEFVVLLEDVSQPQQGARVAEKILRQIAESSQQSGTSVGVTGSIGISFFPRDGDDETILMKNADDAMYRAKELGKNRFEFHSPA